MSKKRFALFAILLTLTLHMVTARPALAAYGSVGATTWYAQWEWNGNDWKVIFYIPSRARGYVIQSNRYLENLVVSRSTSIRQPYGNGMDRVTLTTGYRARLAVGYESIPWSNVNLNTFARSLRIDYWW